MSTEEASLKVVIDSLIPILQKHDGREYLAVAQLLRERLCRPHAFVTVCGETSTGKSSLINGLFRKPLLPVAASPTTATVTHVILREDETDSFYSIGRNATLNEIDSQRFIDLSRTPDKDLLRLQVRAEAVDRRFLGFQVFDTPGYNAILAEHEEVLRAFLPESDVILFVAGYRTGFGQVEQDLLEVISSSLEGRDDVPVMLVVNRAPVGTTGNSRRIVEVLSNAKDCLKREPRLFIVESATSSDPMVPPLPCSMPVWEAILAEVSKSESKRAIQERLWQLTLELLENTASILERKKLLLNAKSSELSEMQEQLDALKASREQSLMAVEKAAERLRTTLPRLVDRLSCSIKTEFANEISNSNKWLGAHECYEWYSGHAMPFAIKKAAASIEEQIAQELDRLNEELAEIANTAIKKIGCSVRIRSDAAERFAQNLTLVIAKRIGESFVEGVIKGLGGRGGVAAGTGNLVKMVVARTGKVFGKTFGREVYNQIGKAFSKRAIARFNVIFMVVMEVVVYLYHVKTWQGKFVNKLEDAIDEWSRDVKKDLLETCIPDILSNNRSGIHRVYDDLADQDINGLSNRNDEMSKEHKEIESSLREVYCLKKIICGD